MRRRCARSRRSRSPASRRCRRRARRASRRAARISASAAAARCSTRTRRCRSPPSSARWRMRSRSIGRVRAERMLPPIEGPAWGYRYRARLTVRHVAKKGGVLVGFHERKSSFVADMTRVPRAAVRDFRSAARAAAAGGVADDLRSAAANRARVGERNEGERRQGDGIALDYALVLRILAPLTPEDEAKLRDVRRPASASRSGCRPAVRPR